MRPDDLAEKLALFVDHGRPRVVGKFNGPDLLGVKVQGECFWQNHEDSDDFRVVLKGHLTSDMPDGPVDVRPGGLFVGPSGVRHRPWAAGETRLLAVERAGLTDIGDPETAAPKVAL